MLALGDLTESPHIGFRMLKSPKTTTGKERWTKTSCKSALETGTLGAK